MKIIIKGLIFEFGNAGPEAEVRIKIKDEQAVVTVAELRKVLKVFS